MSKIADSYHDPDCFTIHIGEKYTRIPLTLAGLTVFHDILVANVMQKRCDYIPPEYELDGMIKAFEENRDSEIIELIGDLDLSDLI